MVSNKEIKETSKKRLLRADEIEVRIGGFNKDKTGGFLLLYKDARVDMRILDEIYGEMNWQRSHEVINGNLFCNISIWDESKGVWITKQDVGVESESDATKGQASDAFKRAAFNWGIGRELYTSPFIWINGLDKYDKFTVKEIGYNDNGEIVDLVIVNKNGNIAHETRGGEQKYINNTPSTPKPAQKQYNHNKATNYTNSTQKNNTGANREAGDICQECGAKVSAGVKKYSMENFDNKILCMSCQNK